MIINYQNDGVEIHHKFLDENLVSLINKEIDYYQSHILFNRNLMGYSTINKYLKEIRNPNVLINSLNLLELAIDVRDKIIHEKPEEYRLTKLSLYIEKNNPKELPWHRDNDKGILTAQIYLRGGDSEKSGAFQYMLNTYNITSNTTHHLSESEIKLNWKKRFVCIGKPGDLIHFNWYGYHSKTICIDERRTLFFEFQSKSHKAIKSDIYLSSSKISPKVIKNIFLFQSVDEFDYIEKRKLDNLNLYISLIDFMNILNQSLYLLIFSRIIKFIKRIFKLISFL